VVLALALSVAGIPSARAYVIDARSVFRRFGEREALDRVTSGALTGRALLAGPGGAKDREVPVRLELTFPGACKGDLELPEGHATAALAGGKLATEGIAVPALAAFAALGCPLLALRNVAASDAEVALVRFASALGIDLSTVSLSRLEKKTAFVVGAKPREAGKPQIWFDKVTSRPLRVMARQGGQLWDIRFEDPASLATNRRAPRVAEVYRGGELQLSMHLMSAAVEAPTQAAGPSDETDDDQE
jgi:hypothetical protein